MTNPELELFSIASERDFLVLYPARADALELRWRLAVPGKRAAEAAFAPQASTASPGVLLRRFGGSGADEFGQGGLLPVASVHAGRMGLIGLRPDAWYQAELGLGTPDGGWLMLARSNRLALPAMASACLPPTASAVLFALASGPAEGKDQPRDHEINHPPLVARHQGFDGGVSDDAGTAAPMAGSGPVRSIRDQSAMALWGELRIGGRAAPGSLLDLGGHAYRVGPGGGFAFDLEITDPELIQSLLRLLPALPAVPRDGG
ncbi:hypothetical protein [Thiorhodovibrio winogradskyi]|uniref:hypothetical protein n=1 Tax=Thiorhodovibrio winogradskyi TaxID=77007 RepID=UPI002E27E98C|nr:hypothetical protein [Thiorhodovibrio winogradskyi]